MGAIIQNSTQKYFQELLAHADIKTDGCRPWDITVKNEEFYSRVAREGSLGLGESYMDGWWECDALDIFFYKILRHKLDEKVKVPPSVITNTIRSMLFNRQSTKKAHEVGERHYDAGNDLFARMLDSRMNYSCGYWGDAKDLEGAQEKKMEMICRKLMLKPGMKLLDIGCGWGGLVSYAAEKYGVSAVGLTISREQARLAEERCAGQPVEIRMQDYREIEEDFDAIVSVGMFEHVGYKNYSTFMDVASQCLREEGLFLLHTIASNTSVRQCDSWFDKYIFPNGMLPSIKQLGDAIEDTFVMEDWQNIGAHYDKTLLAWYANFANSWNDIKDDYNERFFRMWRYYLLSLAGGFRARNMQVWQIVFSREGLVGGYPNFQWVRQFCVNDEELCN